jgi:hypothetical protein
MTARDSCCSFQCISYRMNDRTCPGDSHRSSRLAVARGSTVYSGHKSEHIAKTSGALLDHWDRLAFCGPVFEVTTGEFAGDRSCRTISTCLQQFLRVLRRTPAIGHFRVISSSLEKLHPFTSWQYPLPFGKQLTNEWRFPG